MANVASLTPAQTELMVAFDGQLRSAIMAMNKAVNAANAAALQYNDAAVQIIGTLDNTAPLPTSTGLAGAAPFSQGDPGFLISYLSAFSTWFAANINDSGHQTLYVKACGAVNLAGLP